MGHRMLRRRKVYAARVKRLRQLYLVSTTPVGGRLSSIRSAFHTQAPDTLFVSFQNFNVETPKSHARTRTRHTAFMRDHQAGNRGEIISFDLHVEQALDLSNLSA